MARFILFLTLCLCTLVLCNATADTPTEDVVVERSNIDAALNTVDTPSTAQAKRDVKHHVSHYKRATKALQRLGIKHFLGTNGPAIGSWFRTYGDSTNGHSWCGYPYHDSDPIFAPDVTVMLGDFGWNYEKAAQAYCGLEAVVSTPEGKTMTLYIGDGFDHQWVRTPGSIDITKQTFGKLYQQTDNKNVVIKGVKWRLTGNRSKKFCFKCRGNN